MGDADTEMGRQFIKLAGGRLKKRPHHHTRGKLNLGEGYTRYAKGLDARKKDFTADTQQQALEGTAEYFDDKLNSHNSPSTFPPDVPKMPDKSVIAKAGSTIAQAQEEEKKQRGEARDRRAEIKIRRFGSDRRFGK